jgi:hypothetical protein
MQKYQIIVAERAWPKFNGSGALHPFLAKLEYFMRVTDMLACEQMPKLI